VITTGTDVAEALGLTGAEDELRRCANPDCGRAYAPKRSRQKTCSSVCGRAVAGRNAATTKAAGVGEGRGGL
jgi:hypothetical protein